MHQFLAITRSYHTGVFCSDSSANLTIVYMGNCLPKLRRTNRVEPAPAEDIHATLSKATDFQKTNRNDHNDMVKALRQEGKLHVYREWFFFFFIIIFYFIFFKFRSVKHSTSKEVAFN